MNNKNRIFAILNWKKNRFENVKDEIINKIPLRDGYDDKVIVFYNQNDYVTLPTDIYGKNIDFIPISAIDGHNIASSLNFIYRYLKERYNNSFGYVIYDSMQIKSNPSIFFNEIELMISKLKLDVWFNTYTDIMNFIFNKYDGRLSVNIDDKELKQIYDKTIIFASHCNPNLSIIDIDKFNNEKPFDEKFDIPMYWIIKFLCERSMNNQGFMNEYPTIAEEIGVFKLFDFKDKKDFQKDLQKKESDMFYNFKLNYFPHNNIDELLDFIINRLKS